jgi:hypothetical protein
MINHLPITVIPTKAGIQQFSFILDSRLRGNDRLAGQFSWFAGDKTFM